MLQHVADPVQALTEARWPSTTLTLRFQLLDQLEGGPFLATVTLYVVVAEVALS